MVCNTCEKCVECEPYIQNLQNCLHKPILSLCNIGVSKVPLEEKMNIVRKTIGEKMAKERLEHPPIRRAAFISKPLDHGNHKDLFNHALTLVFR